MQCAATGAGTPNDEPVGNNAADRSLKLPDTGLVCYLLPVPTDGWGSMI
ncbi:MAG: hypothetical protein GY820_11305 [Gammaproteobacteria bacterium]|nr:hypothetical protein [Gammaproteobacteria bacterium]